MSGSLSHFTVVISLDGLHRPAEVHILCKTGKHPWTIGHCIHIIIHPDGANMSKEEAIKISKVSTTSSVMVQKDCFICFHDKAARHICWGLWDE